MCGRRAGAPSRFVNIEKRVFDEHQGWIALVLVDGGGGRSGVGVGVGKNNAPAGRPSGDCGRRFGRDVQMLHTDQLWASQQRMEIQRGLTRSPCTATAPPRGPARGRWRGDQQRTAETAHGPLPRREFPLVFLRGLHCQHSPRRFLSWYFGGQGHVPCIGDTIRGAIVSAWEWRDRRRSQRRKGNSMSRACRRRLNERPSCTRIDGVPTVV